MAWDKNKIAEGVLAPDLNDEIRVNWAALEAALDAYIRFETGGTQTGQPRQGSARIYYQGTAPAARLDGDYFDLTDYGTPWIDSDNSKLYFLTSADGAGTDVWTLASTEIIETLLAAARVFAEVITFSKSPVFTLGIVGNDSYIVGRNNAGDGNINIAKVNTSDGITLGAVTTLPDTSALATSGAPAADAQLANKKYADDKGWNNDGTTVFNASMTAADTFQDLDLSSYVGSTYALVYLEATSNGVGKLAAKPKGYGGSASAHWVNGSSYIPSNFSSKYGYITVATDSAGVIQIASDEDATTFTIKLVGFIGLNP